jgi:hypothetical protein
MMRLRAGSRGAIGASAQSGVGNDEATEFLEAEKAVAAVSPIHAAAAPALAEDVRVVLEVEADAAVGAAVSTAQAEPKLQRWWTDGEVMMDARHADDANTQELHPRQASSWCLPCLPSSPHREQPAELL